ncbi:Protein BYPASS-related [Macleaya cordata]|uniref:Protein BYPASS-related n=1 Tax=Macleaya cordata TaxID=56857 RepID=A0A200QU11_MACCD|nr:Protein BYPASS-related [Macleaya cordata]
MPTTEYQGSSIPLAFLGRSILSLRRNQVVVVSMETHTDQDQEDLELFQKHTSDRFLHLSSDPTTTIDGGAGDNFLSIGWLRNLLDVFLCCEAEFKAVLILGRDPSHISKPPLDRLIPELLDRAVKALDVCNAITNSIESILHWQKLASIAVSVLEQSFLGEGQLRRAKKALNSLLTSMMIEDKDGSTNKTTERTWSFGRRGAANAIKDQNSANLRSFSWGVSKNWSASKQIQAMSANLVVPRGGESTGLALPVYIMSTVLVFVMWVLVTAIPCQDRTGLANNFQVPRQPSWSGPIIALQDRISDEWKKKEKKGSVGLLEEIQRLEKCSQGLIELADTVQFPVEAEQAEEIKARTIELGEICRKMEDGLVPLQRQVREVFHRIVRSRSEVLDLLEPTGKFSSSIL